MATVINARCSHGLALGECGEARCAMLAIEWRKQIDAPMPKERRFLRDKRCRKCYRFGGEPYDLQDAWPHSHNEAGGVVVKISPAPTPDWQRGYHGGGLAPTEMYRQAEYAFGPQNAMVQWLRRYIQKEAKAC